MDIIIAFSKYYDADEKLNDLLIDHKTSSSNRKHKNLKSIYSSDISDMIDMININDDTEYVFKHAAKNGNLHVAKWAHQCRLEAGLDLLHDSSTSPIYYDIFELSCEFGQLVISKWIYQEYQQIITKNTKVMHTAFKLASKNGHLETIKWLYHINPIIVVDCYDAFDLSCSNGHIEIADWLIKLGAVTSKQVEKTFIDTCKKGHLECAKLLIHYDISDIAHDKAFVISCCNNHLSLSKWLISISKLNELSFNDAFISVCRKGYFDIAVWLYNLGSVDIRINDDISFKHCCINKHTNIAKWLAGICSDYVLKLKNNKIKNWSITKMRDHIKDKTDDEIIKFLNLKISSSDQINQTEQTNQTLVQMPYDKCFICLDDSNIKFNCGHHCCLNCMLKWYVHEDREKKCELCKKKIDFNNTVLYKIQNTEK